MDYPPLRDYGVIGNDDRCALISLEGSVDWWCLPHLESPSVFARLLDADRGGHFTVQPTADFEANHRYVDRTNVLETTFETATGQATVVDWMPIRGGDPGDERFQHAIYRWLAGDRGSIELSIEFAPRFDYARADTTIERTGTGAVARGGTESLHLLGCDDESAQSMGETDCDLELLVDEDASTAYGSVTLEENDQCWLGVQYGGSEPMAGSVPSTVLEETTRYWQEWLDGRDGAPAAMPERWHEAIVRSELVLKLLIHHETGAIPAAATTSIPEEIGSDRTWDYRFNWIRDAKFTVQALHDTGHEREAREYFEWFTAITCTDPESIQPLYGLHGETDIEERTLDHFEGYRGTGPVRIGNAAAPQLQLDAYGTIVQAVYETTQFDAREYERGPSDGKASAGDGPPISADDWGAICDIVDYVCVHWDERDAGIWEFRDDRRHFLHSKLLCWVALDRAITLATDHALDAQIDRWRETRGTIREAIEDRGYSEAAGSFVQHFETDEAIDATALLISPYEFLPPDDERVQSTIDTVIDRLTTEDGLVLRFVDTDIRRDEREAFVLCSCWLVDALVLSNRLELAREYFETVLDSASPLGLYSEKLDPVDGTLLGNFPQAFSHLGLLNSATYLTRALDTDAEVDPDDFHPGEVETLFRRG